MPAVPSANTSQVDARKANKTSQVASNEMDSSDEPPANSLELVKLLISTTADFNDSTKSVGICGEIATKLLLNTLRFLTPG